MEKYPARIMRKSIYIPNGLEQSGAVPETDFLCGKGIEPGNYLLAVGRITPEKGFHFLIEAIQQCAAVSRLVIAGGSDHDSTYPAADAGVHGVAAAGCGRGVCVFAGDNLE